MDDNQTKIETGELKHSSLGASSCSRWWNCPGSVALLQKYPASPTSEAAAEGTAAHALLEGMLKGRLDKSKLMKLKGTKSVVEGHTIEVTADMIDAVLLFFNTALADFEEMKAANRPAPIQVLIENHVRLRSVDNMAYGSLDFTLAQKGNTLRVYDFKYGKGVVVEHVGNKQGLFYTIGCIDDKLAGCEAFDKVEIVIIQPRARHEEGPVRRWVVPISEVQSFRKQLIERVAATRKENAELNAGSWCRWCAANADCPAKLKAIQEATALDFAALPVPKDGAVSAAAMPANTQALKPVDEMTPEMMAKVLAFEDMINNWFEAIRERVQERLEKGQEVPGWKLVNGRSNRQWKDEKEVVAKFEGTLGDGIYQPRKLRSPADLEGVVGKKQVAELTYKPEGKKAIAPISDPRPAVGMNTAAADFKHLPPPAVPVVQSEPPAATPSPVVKTEDALGDLI